MQKYVTADWLTKKVTVAVCQCGRRLIIYVTETQERVFMGMRSKFEYLKDIRIRYKYATELQKKTILDEFCATFTYNRKYAIRMLDTKETADGSISEQIHQMRIGHHKTGCHP